MSIFQHEHRWEFLRSGVRWCPVCKKEQVLVEKKESDSDRHWEDTEDGLEI